MVKNVIDIVAACVALYMCEMCGHAFLDHWNAQDSSTANLACSSGPGSSASIDGKIIHHAA